MEFQKPIKRRIKRPFDPATAQNLSQELNISRVTSELLAVRGIVAPEAGQKFLAPSLADLHDPFLMRDMRKAVDRILAAVERRQRILIYGDYDVDGTTSTVILKKALTMAGADVSYYIPERLRDGYGLRTDAMDQARQDGFDIVISVDTGIRAHEVVDHANSIGLEVIITDHHLPSESLPRATAVLNPKRSDCDYPNKNLAGVGVAFKLAQALLTEIGRPQAVASFVKIAAIGTIADVVPLVGENRVIAKCGLDGLGDARNFGLRALLSVAGLADKPVSCSDVGFRLAPRINAAGRMAAARRAVELFDAPDFDTALKLAQEMDGNNTYRQRTETDVVAQILAELDRDNGLKNDRVAVIAGEGWHRGVIGIAASRVVDHIYRPAIVISIDQGLGHGSARSVPGFHLLDGLTDCGDLFERFGGHSHAAGLVIKQERIQELRTRLNEYALRVLPDDELIPTIQIDMALPSDQTVQDTFEDIRPLEPFGAGNPEPVFELARAQMVGEARLLKEKHLKFRVMTAGRWMDCVWWGNGSVAADIFAGDQLSLAFTLTEHTWNGNTEVQLTLRDLVISG